MQKSQSKACAVCAGSGKLVLMKTWFAADGFRRCKCGICAGTGESDHDAPEYAKEQAHLREVFKIAVGQ